MTLADYDGRTALHLSSAEGHVDCVDFLLRHCHVPYNVKDRWGNMPIDEAKAFGHSAVIELLQNWGAKKSEGEDMKGDSSTPVPPHTT